jgi:hypothetical protein
MQGHVAACKAFSRTVADSISGGVPLQEGAVRDVQLNLMLAIR